VLTSVGKAPMSASVTPVNRLVMTCFDERTSIWPAIGASWRTKLDRKNLDQAPRLSSQAERRGFGKLPQRLAMICVTVKKGSRIRLLS
jgi:hypothetical protein